MNCRGGIDLGPSLLLALPPALGDLSLELINSYPKGKKRDPWNKNWIEIAHCLAGCLSLPWAAGDSPQRLPWSGARPESHSPARLERPQASLWLCWQSHRAYVTKSYSRLVLVTDLGSIWPFVLPEGSCRGVFWVQVVIFDRCCSSHRSSKNKQGTVGVGYFERWRRYISVKETSEYSVGLVAASLGGCVAAEKDSFLPSPDLSSHSFPHNCI